MSVEGPETRILGEQLRAELPGRTVRWYRLRDTAGLQRSGMVNPDLVQFEPLAGSVVESVSWRGNTLRIRFARAVNLILCPEYGGRILLHDKVGTVPDRSHVVLGLDDDRLLSVRLTGMGVLRCDPDDVLPGLYVYRRDFSEVADPTNEPVGVGDLERLLAGSQRALKAALVGKDAVVVGVSNSLFQDVAHRAGLHPKRTTARLSHTERHRLAQAIRTVIDDRLRLGGKIDFVDLHGTPGRYLPAMGPYHKDRPCRRCGSAIEAIAVGGGRVYHCPHCQPGSGT